MAEHVVAAAADVPPGARIRVEVEGQGIAIFNVGGAYYGLLDRCPHMGGRLSEGVQIGLVEGAKPGCYDYARAGEIVRCPWHGWEFDIRTGKSRFDPVRWKTRTFDVDLEEPPALHAETVEVAQHGANIIVRL